MYIYWCFLSWQCYSEITGMRNTYSTCTTHIDISNFSLFNYDLKICWKNSPNPKNTVPWVCDNFQRCPLACLVLVNKKLYIYSSPIYHLQTLSTMLDLLLFLMPSSFQKGVGHFCVIYLTCLNVTVKLDLVDAAVSAVRHAALSAVRNL